MSDLSSNLSPDSEVVKSNSLVEASYKLTLVEQQLVLFAICEGREQLEMLTESSLISIDALEFAKQFGLNPTNVYAQLKEAQQTLFNRQLVIRDKNPKSGKPRTTKVRWVTKVSYTDGDGVLQFQFSADVIPYITRLEAQYTRYRLGSLSGMSSVYAIRVYELLAQYLGIGARRFELLELKRMLGVEGEYSDISDFKKRVLDVAVLQINQHSDIKIAYTQEKTGRIVTAFVFSIRKKPVPKTASKAVLKAPARPTQLGLDMDDSEAKNPRTPESEAKRSETLRALAELKAKRV